MGRTDERGGVGERVRDDPHTLVERDRMSSAAPGKWLTNPTPNGRSVSARTARIWLDEPGCALDGRPADETETARLRDRGRERRRGVAAAHRRVEHRDVDAEEVAQRGVESHAVSLPDPTAPCRPDGRRRAAERRYWSRDRQRNEPSAVS